MYNKISYNWKLIRKEKILCITQQSDAVAIQKSVKQNLQHILTNNL